MTIRCQGIVFKVHTSIVCGQCPFFANACFGNFAVSFTLDNHLSNKAKHEKEAVNNEIDLKDDHPAAVKAMLKWIYTRDYQYEIPNNGSELDLQVEVSVNSFCMDSGSEWLRFSHYTILEI
jgi:hypothetical protein